MSDSTASVVCIGAGPAGLTAAYLLSRKGVNVTVLEQDPVYVGGISRTETYKSFGIDIGGHRFFSKSREVEDLWTEMLGDDMLERPRKSRICYRGSLFAYPLRATDALRKLGPIEAARCVFSYIGARLQPVQSPRNFQDWVVNQFGRRLFEIFFRTYTEKVWGMKCTEISADWAAQRIKGLSLTKAIWHALLPQKQRRPREKIIKTLVDSFRYPRRGPGMLWEAAADSVVRNGGEILLGRRVLSMARDKASRRWTIEAQGIDGAKERFTCDHVISSMPMREMISALAPEPPFAVREAANALRYRDFLVVALIVKDHKLFDDNWIYIHDPNVKVGRIQNFRSWSPEMVPQDGLNCYGLEYFCFEGDGIWTSSDKDLVALATKELIALGLADASSILDGTVVRQPKAYPVYDDGYQERVAVIREEIESNYANLHLVGRNGMHKYNNQDHAMMTAMLVAKNIIAGSRLYDQWLVNQDAEYHEECGADVEHRDRGGRSVPALASASVA
jgi:protoporphyrinogen oxidase